MTGGRNLYRTVELAGRLTDEYIPEAGLQFFQATILDHQARRRALHTILARAVPRSAERGTFPILEHRCHGGLRARIHMQNDKYNKSESYTDGLYMQSR